ncbi:chemotaxis protein CheC [Halalkalibacter akibai]|uniref:Chemotaxis protein CheC-inhibitor of MCP methylation n=1 Tax=Halalkalibacter akibai (strain ATCC 43226 / DSM 21942 / CIP 109018 / JCM 9157 / 1139) TaxID=1236973 RepID=W4QV82_HALA3|nr:chemotaxis protein CheC [Halalkalibacter akibai]GAE36050.1 chemotaxis protein CheC - inhibitor of MCP methylation [Halalkalibacter akibai JCM 9157]
MEFFHKLKPHHLDVLKEIGNIGAGHAATALSQILNQTIDMSVPAVRIVSFQDLPEQIGGADTEVAAIFLRIEGEAPGSIFYISQIKEAEKLIQRLTKDSHFQLEDPPFNELGISAFLEVGNILAGSYLSSLADFTNLLLQPSVPGFTVDMVGAILNYGLIPLSEVSDYAIVIDTEMMELGPEAGKIRGHFFLLPDPQSFNEIFTALGVKIP